MPFLGISPTAPLIATQSAYKFNSLQVTVRKQLSYGLQLQAAYTWSRAFIALPFFINTPPYDVFAYEPNNNYRPHRLVISYLWNLPLGHADGWKRFVVEGWSLSGVTTFQNGSPLTITDGTGGSIFFGGQGANSNAQFCAGKTKVDLIGSGPVEDRVNSYFSVKDRASGVLCSPPMIAVAGIGTGGTGFGNAGGGIVLGPGQNNWDMSIAKIFPIVKGRRCSSVRNFLMLSTMHNLTIQRQLPARRTSGK